MTRPFEHIVLPVKCPCGGHQTHVSLADLIERPITFECSTCGEPFVIDVRTHAAQVGSALRPRAHAAADLGLQLCTLSLDPER